MTQRRLYKIFVAMPKSFGKWHRQMNGLSNPRGNPSVMQRDRLTAAAMMRSASRWVARNCATFQRRPEILLCRLFFPCGANFGLHVDQLRPHSGKADLGFVNLQGLVMFGLYAVGHCERAWHVVPHKNSSCCAITPVLRPIRSPSRWARDDLESFKFLITLVLF